MINMAVISLKDIVQYIIKITIVIAIIIAITRFVSNKKVTDKSLEIIQNNSFVSCLDVTIPGISALSEKEEKVSRSAINPLQMAFEVELEMLSAIEDGSQTLASTNEKNSNGSNNESEGVQNQSANGTQNQSTEGGSQGQTESNQNTNEDQTSVEKAQTGLKTEVQKTNVPEKYTTQYNGVKVKNETDYKLTKEILTPNIEVSKENIVIFHTHACESYTSSPKYTYKPTGNFRTTDKNYSVVRVGKELKNQLQSYGYKVIHNETLHDYPSYSGSYTNSLATVTNILKENKNTDIVIDLHRDAIGDTKYAPTVKIGDEYAAQLMFVVGGNGSKIKHEDWKQNLKFAIKVQEKANELYPGLFKPIILRYSGYNQHVSKAACLIEVGATGNTLDQTLVSMKYLAKVLDEILK